MLLLRGVAILHLTLTIKTAANPCPHLCSCSQDTVICTGQGLLSIPSKIPPDTVRLQLMDNQIHIIESDAFDNLIALERLRLNRNRLRTLPDEVFINNVNLHRLLVFSEVIKPFYALVEIK
uniref:LRRNT domain-containing protein n=1 Tax=Elaeophora elaphi TaxID=1147741 RepID=A0A0R3RWR6_9BILA